VSRSLWLSPDSSIVILYQTRVSASAGAGRAAASTSKEAMSARRDKFDIDLMLPKVVTNGKAGLSAERSGRDSDIGNDWSKCHAFIPWNLRCENE